MKLRILILSLAAALVAVAGIAPARPARAFDNGCYGQVSKYLGCWWPTQAPYAPSVHVAHWCYNQSSYPVFGGQQATEEAAQNWNNAVGQWMLLVEDPPCNNPSPLFDLCDNGGTDGRNMVTIVYGQLQGSEDGVNCNFFDSSTGQLIEDDIWLDYQRILGDPQATVKNIAVHEFAHMLGLDHSTQPAIPSVGVVQACLVDVNAVMCPGSYAVTPDWDDVAGIRFIYADLDQDGCTGMQEYANAVQSGHTEKDYGDRLDGANTPWYPGRFVDFPDPTGDRQVNALDLNVLGQWMLHRIQAVGGDAPNNVDFNGDGAVNGLDLNILGTRFLLSCAGPL